VTDDKVAAQDTVAGVLPPVRPAGWVLAATFTVCFALQFHWVSVNNDHFDRVTRGWQILNLGAVPFRDFFDPGYFLTLYSSALAQWIFGANLFGEFLLASLFIAAGYVLLFRLATEVSRSVLVGGLLTLVVVATQPRAYDYDKVFFYAAGVALCWHYARHQTVRSLAVLAVCTAVAGMYRADNGLYVAVAAAVTIGFCHWPNTRVIARRSTLYLAVGLTAALPVLLFLTAQGGIGDAARQVIDYARREGARTSVFRAPVAFSLPTGGWPISLAPADTSDDREPLVKVRWGPEVSPETQRELEQSFSLHAGHFDGDRTWYYRLGDASRSAVRRLVGDPGEEDTAGIDRSRFTTASVARPPDWPPPWYSPSRLQFSWEWEKRENAVAWCYYVLVLLPWLCIATLVWRAIRARGLTADRVDVAGVAATAAFTVIASTLILRFPVSARYGTVAVPAAVLAAWLVGQWRGFSRTGGPTHDRASRRPETNILRRACTILGGAVITVTCLSVSVLHNSNGRLNLTDGPAATLSSAAQLVDYLSLTPPDSELLLGNAAVGRYLRACTRTSDRLMLGWFAPDIPYFAGRGFSGGMLVYFGSHWSEPTRQFQVVRRMRGESVPIALLREPEDFRQQYPVIYADLEDRYDALGPMAIGDQELHLFVVQGRPATRRYLEGRTNLPCFGD
jgi:hypothetical protein